MLFQILPGNLALPLVFVFKFILFIAFPLGTLAKEIRGLTNLSGAKVVQLKDDLKREFERHYTQRDEHFNRLITERMSDLKQTVALLNQERIESKLKLELLENKVDQVVAKLELISAEDISKTQQNKLHYVQLSEKWEKVDKEMAALGKKFNSMSTKASSPVNKAKNYELLSSKISEVDSRANLLKTKVAFIEEKLSSTQDSVQTNFSYFQTRLTALEANYKSITPLKEQAVIKYLLEQVIATENALDMQSNDIKQLSNSLTDQINKAEKEQGDRRTFGENLKKQVAKLTEEFKITNFAIGKLQTVAHEHYRTLLPTVEKVNAHEEHLVELAAIVNDIADYHMQLVNSEDTIADPILEVQDETEARKESHDTALAKPTRQGDQHDKQA
ncbi:hypothetical protein PS15p_200714 [Mucor circinelloides]